MSITLNVLLAIGPPSQRRRGNDPDFPMTRSTPVTHALTMVNNVIGVVNYVIAARPSLLNFMIADSTGQDSWREVVQRDMGDEGRRREPARLDVRRIRDSHCDEEVAAADAVGGTVRRLDGDPETLRRYPVRQSLHPFRGNVVHESPIHAGAAAREQLKMSAGKGTATDDGDARGLGWPEDPDGGHRVPRRPQGAENGCVRQDLRARSLRVEEHDDTASPVDPAGRVVHGGVDDLDPVVR